MEPVLGNYNSDPIGFERLMILRMIDLMLLGLLSTVVILLKATKGNLKISNISKTAAIFEK